MCSGRGGKYTVVRCFSGNRATRREYIHSWLLFVCAAMTMLIRPPNASYYHLWGVHVHDNIIRMKPVDVG